MLLYKCLIWDVVREWKACCRAAQRSSRPWNTLPDSFWHTKGQTCSMGFISGEFGGQIPPLNMLNFLASRNLAVDLDLCTLAPSCWNWYALDLRRTKYKPVSHLNQMQLNTPGPHKRESRLQNVMVITRFDFFGTAFEHQFTFAVDGCPHHYTFGVLLCLHHVFGLVFAGSFRSPTANHTPGSGAKHFFIAEDDLGPLGHIPPLKFSGKVLSSCNMFSCQKRPFDCPPVDIAHFQQKSPHSTPGWFVWDLKRGMDTREIW